METKSDLQSEEINNQDEKNNSDEIKKDSNIDSQEQLQSSDSNIILNQNNINSSIELIKPSLQKSDFEKHIICAYNKLFSKNANDTIINRTSNLCTSQVGDSPSKINIKFCEIEIRSALAISSIDNITLNKNILEKLTQITKQNKMNFTLLIAQIYIILMTKENLFDSLNDNKLLFSFITEFISIHKKIQNTYLSVKYNKILLNFIINSINKYKFDSDKLTIIQNFLQNNAVKCKMIKIKNDNFAEMVESITENLSLQENSYDQYKLIFNNIEIISKNIENSDINDQNNLTNLNSYLDLGKIFAYLLFNKKYAVYLKRQTQGDDVEEEGTILKTLFDGYEDNTHIIAIEGEKFSVYYDEETDSMREMLCEIIIKYIQKYIVIKNVFEFQYVLYVLIKRIYFHYLSKYKEIIESLLSEIMINLCFFKVDTVEEIKLFMNELLKSELEETSHLKQLLIESIEQNKSNPDFSFNYNNTNTNNEQEVNENYFTNINNISNEAIFILENDLKIGFFLTKTINSREVFTFYVELTNSFGILDFCLMINEYDIKIKITNLTEGQIVYSENEITPFHCPLKLTMFFSKPGIFQFDIDNSYSWLRSKTIKYKLNIFYPQKPYYIERRIHLMKYQETISNSKKMNSINLKLNPTPKEKILLVKFNGSNNSFNCIDFSFNIDISNKMIRDKFLGITSIYIDNNNSKFYYKNKENNLLIKKDLNKENFMNFLKNDLLPCSIASIDIINLYIISENSSIIDNHYVSIEDILGFEPDIINNSKSKILFFLQYLHQAQMLYHLYKKIQNSENVNVIFLINYTVAGYQICLYKNGEIFIKQENILDLTEDVVKNVGKIAEEIRKIESENVEILVGEGIEDNDVIECNKIYDELINIFGMNIDDEDKYIVNKINKEVNKEIELNSHLFYLDE